MSTLGNFKTSRGFPIPYGASKHEDGFNFALFSKHATAVFLCLFEGDTATSTCEIPLDPKKNKTGDVWHIHVHGLPSTWTYGYRVEGPYAPFQGHYFDTRSILVDPYAKGMASCKQWGASAYRNALHIQKGTLDSFDHFDWEEDTSPNIPMKDLIIYEMHVRGFTQDQTSNVEKKGTFLGMIDKIPYLKSLGINAVELLPIFEFNERENPKKNPITNKPLFQYWGYSTINFFSPMRRFASENPILEFKQLVKALHANGIEVILDVVYNHTSEGNQDGPILSYKGIENSVYYMLGPNGEYYNFTGCGNTFNCNHPVVRHFIINSLHYWVTEMHVDGFRFDLASILCRGHDGIPLERPPVVEAISLDPILSHTKLIAEAWDAGGLYQVGSFPGFGKWSEWNGRYRDEVRAFIKGTDNLVGRFATRLSGSEDLYGRGRSPLNSINFIIAHDGFTLADLVSYNGKHNEENGEDNRDGTDDNVSWNCGAEGETKDPAILQLRAQQMRNFHVALMISQGIPMLHMGDEYAHTKKGNNNTWSQDSRLNWFLWDELEKNTDFFRFYRSMIDFRKSHPILSRSQFLKDKDIFWHGKEVGKPDWTPKSRFLAFTLPDPVGKYELYIAFNAQFDAATCQLPTSSKWYRIVDTSQKPPQDFLDKPILVKESTYTLPSHSCIILCSKK